MERKSPRWLSNKLLRLVDHKRAVREESRACVHVWVWEGKQKSKTFKLCIFVCICVRVCDRKRHCKKALLQVGLVNGSASLGLNSTRHYKSRVVTRLCLCDISVTCFQTRKRKPLIHLFSKTACHTVHEISVCLSTSGQRREGRWNLLPQHARVWEGKKVISAEKGEWGTKTAQEFRGNLKSSVGEGNKKCWVKKEGGWKAR